MSNTYTGLAAGSLVIQKYNNFKGVDFTDDITSLYRSPDCLNMFKNYKTLGKCVETRPGLELKLSFNNTIYGLFSYTINSVQHWIIHCGTSLIDYNSKTNISVKIKESGMNPSKSQAFIYNNIFYIIDGLNYLEYNGTILKDVVGTIPTTSITCKPAGGGKLYQDINLLSDYRKNTFWADGTSKEYHLDSKEISSTGVSVWITDISTGVDVLQDTSTYTIDATNGIITFNTAPTAAASADNVIIQFMKVVSGYADKLKRCNLTAIFDNRVFFSGNQDYPNAVFWCNYNDPRYVSDMNYSNEGTDLAKVKALVPGNNALWVFKESSQSNTTVFYHSPLEVTDTRLNDTVKTYPSTHSSITTGCNSSGINFNDDIVFFSDRGMEGISGDITTEQVIAHRSTLVDRKLLNELNYNNMKLIEWEGYLLVIVDNIIYLADSRQKVTNNDHIEYEWFYWNIDKKIENANVIDGTLYLCSKAEQAKDNKGYLKYTDGTNIYWHDYLNSKLYDNSYNEIQVNVNSLTAVVESGIYTLTDYSVERNIYSCITTSKDDYNYPQMLKTTNKKGFKTDVQGSIITIDVKTDNNSFENLGTYLNTKGYIVSKIKRKKWNSIQLKFSSNKPFGLYEVALEAFIGSYLKRS